jgi:hypothetical protein
MKFIFLFCLFCVSAFGFEKVRYPLSAEPIDVVIPCAKKDAEKLPCCIEGIRKWGENVRRVIVISEEKLTEEAEWFDEKKFPFSKQQVAGQICIGDTKAGKRLAVKQRSRLGWVLQQLFKLYAPLVIPNISSNVLVLDADVLFLRPVSFMNAEGAPFFNISQEHYPPYFEHMARVLPGLCRVHPEHSGVTHHMLFQRPILEDLFQKISEAHRGLPAWKVLCRCIDRRLSNALSEYEIYFNFAQARSDQPILRPLAYGDTAYMPSTEGLVYITSHIYGDLIE